MRVTPPDDDRHFRASTGFTLATAAPSIGVMDLMRFHKFTIGWAWIFEYCDSDDVGFLPGYSPSTVSPRGMIAHL